MTGRHPLVSTILLAAAMLAGGLGQLFHAKRFAATFAHLGYPASLLWILGVWQVLGFIAVVTPGFPTLKQWAYAGLFFMYTGAAASHLFAGDPAVIWLVPLLLTLLTLTSWRLSPDYGRARPLTQRPGRHRTLAAIGYWTTTVLTAFVLISGGLWLMSNSRLVVSQQPLLGFPAYFWQILGFYKVLGGIAILMPRFGLTKEWAYAGIVFNLTGAVAVRAFTGDSVAHIVAPALICAIAVLPWKLRPESRKPSVAATKHPATHASVAWPACIEPYQP